MNFQDVFKVDHIGMVSKDIVGFIMVLFFSFSIKIDGKRVEIDFKML